MAFSRFARHFHCATRTIALLLGVIACDSGVISGRPDASGEVRDAGAPDARVRADAQVVRPIDEIILGTGATAEDPARFETGDENPSLAPSLVYPDTGVMVPPNLGQLEFHFRPAQSDVFELRVEGEAFLIRIYFGCTELNGGCTFAPDETAWNTLANAARGRGPLRYRLRGVLRGSAGIGTSEERTIEFAEEAVNGGLYYWNAGAGAILRYDFGRRGQEPENYLDAARIGADEGTCVGCHALSREGDRIAFSYFGGTGELYSVYEVGERRSLYDSGTADLGYFFAFSPNSNQFLATDGGTINLRDGESGAALAEPLISSGTMPDWSPDGNTIVFARGSGFGGGGFIVDSASLETYVRGSGEWVAGPTLVPFDGRNNYYPAFSPDSAWVLFNRSPSNASSYDAPDAQLWAVPAAGGSAVHLVRSGSDYGDSWPKFAPESYRHRGGSLFWITVSSRRPYGLRTAAGEHAQLWMGAFDPSDPSDPGRTMFWLPFQETDSGNHIAQWVTEVERQECTPDTTCGPGEFCEGGVCVPELF